MGNGDEIEFRLRHLEMAHASHKAATDEQIRTLFVNFGSLMQTLSEQTRELARLNTNIETDRAHYVEQKKSLDQRLCANPNLCLDLKPKVEKHEKILNEQKGGWKVLCALFGAAGAIGGLVGWLLSHWGGKPPVY
jgi:DNA repair exonuclease SbcCD ATPase subunit